MREFPLDTALEMIKTLRTPYVNFKSVHIPYEKSPDELAALRKQIEEAGFQIVGGGTITFEKDTDADVEKYFVYAKAAGMPTMVCTGDPVVPRVEKFAKQYDIKVAIHNHGTEDHHFPSPYDVLKHVKGMDPRMGLCIDVGHTVRTGTDVVKAVLDAGPRLHDMHVKDLADMSRETARSPSAKARSRSRDLSRAEKIKFRGLRESRVRDQREGSAAGHAGVVRLHARRARRHR